MNQLPLPRQVQIVTLLTEGMSLRAIHRLTHVHRDTILRLSITVGEACDRLHDALMRDLQPAFLQLDEQWTFIHTKQRRLKTDDPDEYGSAYLWLAFDPQSKAVLSYHVGKRTAADALVLVRDLHSRLLNHPQISTDGFEVYVDAIREVFGVRGADYGMIVKDANFTKEVVFGEPDLEQVSTSLIERCNLTTRMQLRRHARRTNAHSKLLANHRTAVALHFAFYHFCRVHETLRVTPAMELGLTDHIWSVAELIEEARGMQAPDPPPAQPVRRPPRLRVIQGGRGRTA